jgi:hypothetical protein
LRAALRVGATLPPPPPPPQEEPVNNPPPEVHPLAAANRPGSTLPAPGPQFYTYEVASYLPDFLNNPPPPNLQPPNTFALGQRPQRLLPILAEPDPYVPSVIIEYVDTAGGGCIMIVLLTQIAPGLKKVLLRLSSKQLGEDAAGLIGTTLRGADRGSDSLAVTTTDNNNGASSGTQSAGAARSFRS